MKKKTIKTQIIEFILSTPNSCVKRKDIIKYIIENIKHKKYIPALYKGYYSTNLRKGICSFNPKIDYTGYLRKPSKNEPRYLDVDENHNWFVVE